jgi:hypothetical protein
MVEICWVQNDILRRWNMMEDLENHKDHKGEPIWSVQSIMDIIDEVARAVVSDGDMEAIVDQYLQNYDIEWVYEELQEECNLTQQEIEEFKKKYLAELYDAHWIPYLGLNADVSFMADIYEVLKSTRKSKSRTQKIDRVILEYYSKNLIEEIKKSWRCKGLPNHITRMLHQAVQAYYRREYALTVVMMATLWEGIIYKKAHDPRGKSGKRTMQNFEKLRSENAMDISLGDYFKKYIFYDCRKIEDCLPDVPGRNSAAHGYYSEYPTRKAALNAIMVTDFLLSLDSLNEKSMCQSTGEV